MAALALERLAEPIGIVTALAELRDAHANVGLESGRDLAGGPLAQREHAIVQLR